jgi:hypothetical protein
MKAHPNAREPYKTAAITAMTASVTSTSIRTTPS